MNRFTAFATHIGISLVLFLVFGFLILYHWYPSIFFATDGGWQGIRIVAFVDLVLGPTLTLAVFKVGKPGLKTDLTLIGILQTVCLIAGTYVVYSERGIWQRAGPQPLQRAIPEMAQRYFAGRPDRTVKSALGGDGKPSSSQNAC